MARLQRLLSLCVVLGVFASAIPVAAQAQRDVSTLTSGIDRFETSEVSRPGFDLYFRWLGAGEPVLLLSGGPGDDSDYMLPVASEISRYARAILLEQRGTGRSMPSRIDESTINLAAYLADYEALRTNLDVQQWSIVGHSAGELLAMYYAATYPERVNKLVLLDSAPVAFRFLIAFDDNVRDRLSVDDRERLVVLGRSKSLQARCAVAQLQANALFFDRQMGGQLAEELCDSWHADVGRLLGAEITPSGYDLRPQLQGFDRPVLVLHGRQDPMDPLMAYETSSAFDNATLKFIDRAGHFPWFEQPKQFSEELREFLDSK